MLQAGIRHVSGRADMDADSRTVGTTTTPARSDGDRARVRRADENPEERLLERGRLLRWS